MTRILVIDNYDSFVFTLVGYIQQLGAETTVIRNDEYRARRKSSSSPKNTMACLSLPAPVPPQRQASSLTPSAGQPSEEADYWGVCLGHQAIRGGIRRHRHPRPRADARQDLAAGAR